MRLAIDRLDCTYRLPAAGVAADAARRRLDAIARARMPRLLAAACERAMGGGEGVLLIDRLDADADLGPIGRLSDEQVGRRWAAALAEDIRARVDDPGGARDGVAWFASRADYVAAFVDDVLAGRARGRWEYRAFAAIAERPAAEAASAALADPGAPLPAVLAALDRRGALDRLLSVLPEASARRLVDSALGRRRERDKPRRPAVADEPVATVADAPAGADAATLAASIVARVRGVSVSRTVDAETWTRIEAALARLASPVLAALGDALAAPATGRPAADRAAAVATLLAVIDRQAGEAAAEEEDHADAAANADTKSNADAESNADTESNADADTAVLARWLADRLAALATAESAAAPESAPIVVQTHLSDSESATTDRVVRLPEPPGQGGRPAHAKVGGEHGRNCAVAVPAAGAGPADGYASTADHRASPGDTAALAPLVDAALVLAERLGLRRPPTGEGPAGEGAEAVRAAAIASLADRVGAGPDWDDAAALARAVADAVGVLHRLGAVDAVEPASLTDEALAAALSGLGWLDAEALRSALASTAVPGEPWGAPTEATAGTSDTRVAGALRGALASAAAPGEPWSAPTGATAAAFDACVTEAAAVLRAEPAIMAPRPGSPTAGALRLLARLGARFPAAADTAAVIATVRLVLETARAVSMVGTGATASEDNERATPVSDLDTLRAAAPSAPGLVDAVAAALTTAMAEWMETPHAGVARLVRGVLDARLDALAESDGGVETPTLLAALFRRWAGEGTESLDPALAVLAGLPVDRGLGAVAAEWAAVPAAEHARLRRALAGAVRGQRLMTGDDLHVWAVELDGARVLVGGDGSAGVWPLLAADGDPTAVVETWIAWWRDAIGGPPERLVVDADLAVGTPPLPVLRVAAVDTDDDPAAATHRQGRDDLAAAAAALAAGRLGDAEADRTLFVAATAVLRLWARWLPGFAEAGVPFLLDQFVRRPGRLRQDGERALVVAVEPGPIDVVLARAGYGDPIEAVPWLGGRRIVFVSVAEGGR